MRVENEEARRRLRLRLRLRIRSRIRMEERGKRGVLQRYRGSWI